MTSVLLAGESWVSQTTHYKGFDHFTSVTFESGSDAFIAALESAGMEVTYLPGHDVPRKFPDTAEELRQYDVVVLSDIGANSILLHPDTFLLGIPTVNRLQLLADWVQQDGGGLVMAGGYLSFQGIEAKAAYRGTPVETVLPVTLDPWDDRIETPQGVSPAAVEPGHPILRGIDGEWPVLLGYNKVTVRPDSETVLSCNGDPLLVTGSAGRGRTLAWTSDIAPHWCPQPFVAWSGYPRLMAQMIEWTAGN